MSDSPITFGATVAVVAAYFSHNQVPFDMVERLIGSVHSALRRIDGSLQLVAEPPTTPAARPPAVPAVPIEDSVQSDYIVCLEDGKKLKMLKRHLKTAYNMTPDAYRERWGLGADYPMTAPSYAEKRSALAKEFGLGRKAA